MVLLAPPMTALAADPSSGPLDSIRSEGGVLPFGISRALPADRPAPELPDLVLCPGRQISVTRAGEALIDLSPVTGHLTTVQTTEDMQLDEESEEDRPA